MRRFALSCCFLLASAACLKAQNFTTSPCNNDGNGHSDRGWFGENRACELRRATIPVTDGRVNVSGTNGGIEVVGEDRNDIALEAKVTAQGSSRDEAEALLREVRILTTGDIHAEGPGKASWGRRNWSVDFRLRVPRRLAATNLHTSNGGINVAELAGDLHASSTNGGVNLRDVNGSIHAETTNGGVSVTLAGDRWHGDGLYVRTTNGGVSVKVPSNFAAHLMAETTNGGVSVGLPGITEEGRLHNHLETDINGGGPPVHLTTTNGGVSVTRL